MKENELKQAAVGLPSEYGQLLADIKARVRSAQLAAFRAANKELVALYWDIGRMIVERKMDAAHGDAVAEQLAEDLRTEFPGIAGFSRRNVFYMREFYVTYHDLPKVQPLVAQIGWTHNLIVLTHCPEPLEREFYIRMTRKFGWSKNVLVHQIENQSYEKTLLNQTNFDKAVTPAIRAQAKLAVKDEYLFDFLELGEHARPDNLRALLQARIDAAETAARRGNPAKRQALEAAGAVSRDRSCSTARVWIWHTRLSVTPSTSAISFISRLSK
jgi:predicted nuclease of restriction endonuclease-like (RecB) superfamily